MVTSSLTSITKMRGGRKLCAKLGEAAVAARLQPRSELDLSQLQGLAEDLPGVARFL